MGVTMNVIFGKLLIFELYLLLCEEKCDSMISHDGNHLSFI